MVHSEDLPSLAPRSRLRGRSFPVCFLHYFMQHQYMVSFSVILSPLPNQNSQVTSDECAASKIGSNGLNGFSLFWGGLVRIDVLKVNLVLMFLLVDCHGLWVLQLNWFQLVITSILFCFPGTPSDMLNILRAQSIADSLGSHS